MKPIRILIADDKYEFIEAATRFLDLESHLSVIGHAASGSEALTQAAALQPDLILMDYLMPGMNGIEATRQIKARPNAPRIVILTAYDIPEYRIQAEVAGADGLVAKMNFAYELLPLIEALFSRPIMAAGTKPGEINSS